jgi:N-acetylmuramoyl-L-alanine amidase
MPRLFAFRVFVVCAFCALTAAEVTAAQLSPSMECGSNLKVMLDAGHTPEQPGATSARGKPEYEFNLELASKVAHDLETLGFAVNLPIIHGIGPQQLANRITIAKNYSPSLFLSIHHDSVQPSFLRKWTFAGQTNYYSDEFSGFSIFVSTLSAKFPESLTFAQILADELIKSGLSPSLHHAMKIAGEGRKLLDAQRGIYENAQLAVLKEALFPAVLLEVGIIVNRSDEISLQTANIQAGISQAITQAVKQTLCGRKNGRLHID